METMPRPPVLVTSQSLTQDENSPHSTPPTLVHAVLIKLHGSLRTWITSWSFFQPGRGWVNSWSDALTRKRNEMAVAHPKAKLTVSFSEVFLDFSI